ncbi:MAG: hypothetical protein GY932_06845, partial [Arcobacter sp.]|nr:hypothetical protein [Arcobacter sp.]
MKTIVIVNLDGSKEVLDPKNVDSLELNPGQKITLDGKVITLAELKIYLKSLLAKDLFDDKVEGTIVLNEQDDKIEIIDVEGEEVLFLGELEAAAAGNDNIETVDTSYVIENDGISDRQVLIEEDAEADADSREVNRFPTRDDNSDRTFVELIDTTPSLYPIITNIDKDDDKNLIGNFGQPDLITNDNTPTITLSIPEGTQVGDIIRLYDGDNIVATKIVTQEDIDKEVAEITPTEPLKEGINNLTATILDELSGVETSHSPSVSITIDTTSTDKPINNDPALIIDESNKIVDNTTTDTTPTISIILPEDAVAGDKVKLYDGDEVIAEHKLTQEDITTGTITITPNEELIDGDHILTTSITDKAGNESEKSDPIEVEIDTTPTDAPGTITFVDDSGEEVDENGTN